ncbi:MAG: type II toxin-antitoxin system RelE/ParE family toxin [Planctomycetes bacterium]|nr:type II toxin-antitoxin system RelE/ParE family toxin [Planctomycetota bacterium]
MEYRIELSSRAERDIEESFAYIHSDAPLNAVNWRRGLEAKLGLLARMPTIFGAAPENRDSSRDAKQFIYGRYRILYTVEADVVFVLSIRHGARQFMKPDEIDEIE